jgi:hypothetical protein
MASKYDPLRRRLLGLTDDRIRLSFEDIERVLGFRLPDSARRHPPWWANNGGSHIQADAWMSVGWRTAQVDIGGERVTFERCSPRDSLAPLQPAQQAGVADTGAAFARDDMIAVPRAALRGGAIRLLEDHCEASGGNLGDAIAAILNGLVVERRRQLVEHFKAISPRLTDDSTAIIRADRDAR